MSKTVYYFLILITLFLSSLLLSQEMPLVPIEWEEIPMADLKMTSYPQDEDAEAVILCDYGETKLNNDLNLVFTRHLRVKIFNKNGYDWGTHSILLYTRKSMESLDDLEGITYILNSEGEVVEKELDSDDIFEEEVDDKHEKVTFTMPGLEPGCIIDIKYSIESESLYLIKDWTFQHDIPVRWSEYRVLMPANIAYAGVSRGFENWEIRETTEARTLFSGTAESMIERNPKCNLQRWAVKNAPALKDVPYISTIDDYTNKVELQLSGYIFRRVRELDILGTWEGLIEELVDSKHFYDQIDVTGDVEDLTNIIIAGIDNPEEKMETIYNWVKNSIVWDGKNRVYPKLDVDEVIEYRKGGSAEINFLLLSLLKSAGIESYPVILSTRANGEIQTLYPIINQFNYVITQVLIGGKKYYLDVTDPLRPYDLLPTKVLSVRGLVIKPESKKPEWMMLNTDKKNITSSQIIVSIDEAGNLNGTIQESYSDYRGLRLRRKLKNEDELEFAKNLYDAEEFGLQLDSITIATKDSIYLPLKISSQFSTQDYAQKNGDLIYVNPLIVHRMESNPFKLKERNFPVDYSYKRKYYTMINLTIPEGYEVLEKFPDKAYRLNKDLKFIRSMTINNNLVQILYRFEISSSIINPKYYQDLKEFYSIIIDLQSEQLVIGKKTEHAQKKQAK